MRIVLKRLLIVALLLAGAAAPVTVRAVEDECGCEEIGQTCCGTAQITATGSDPARAAASNVVRLTARR